MRKQATSLGSLFGSGKVLAHLSDHANLLMRLQNVVDTQLPYSMRGAIAVSNLREGVLVLHVSTPSLASRLKMGMDSLHAALRDQGFAVEDIKVRVRPLQTTPTSSLYAGDRSLGEQGRAAFEQLRDSFDAQDPLAQAIDRLLKDSR